MNIMMIMMTWLIDHAFWIVAVGIIALGAAAAIYSQRQYRRIAAEQAKLAPGLDNPEIDETSPAIRDMVQAARERGEV